MTKNLDKATCAKLDIATTPEEFIDVLGLKFDFAVDDLDVKEFQVMKYAELKLFFTNTNDVNTLLNAFQSLNTYRNKETQQPKLINRLKQAIIPRDRKPKDNNMIEDEHHLQLMADHMAKSRNPNIANVNPSGMPTKCSLQSIVITGHIKKIEEAIKANPAEVDKRNRKGYTALMYGMMNGISSGILPLLQAGANPFLTNHQGLTSLSLGVVWGHQGTSSVLLFYLKERQWDLKTVLNAYDSRGRTLLHYAAELIHVDVVITLLKWGANPNVYDNNQETPIILAIKNGSKKLLEDLHSHGAKLPQNLSELWPGDYREIGDLTLQPVLSAGSFPPQKDVKDLAFDYEKCKIIKRRN